MTCIFVHKWSKWTVLRRFVGEYAMWGGTTIVVDQQRSCERCGKVQLDRQIT